MSNTDPLVSIILPTFNRAYCLTAAAQSVLNQSYRELELIIVDDGSTDSTATVVTTLKDDRVRYLKHATNKGLSAARNTGIAAATGDFIAFQDSDDEWLPGKLEKEIRAFEAAPPKTGVVFTSALRIYPHYREYLPPLEAPRHHPDFHAHLLMGNCITVISAVVRKRCFATAGFFDETLRAFEDWDLWLRISRFFDFVYLNEPLVKVIFTKDSLSSDLRAFTHNRAALLALHEDEFRLNRHARAALSICQARDYAFAGDKKAARENAYRALLDCPDIPHLAVFLIALASPAFLAFLFRQHAQWLGTRSIRRGTGA